MLAILRLVGKISSFIAGIGALTLSGLFIYLAVDYSKIDSMSSGSSIVKDIHKIVMDIFNGVLAFIPVIKNWISENQTAFIVFAVVFALLGLWVFFISISNKKINNLLEIGIGVVTLLFVSWIIAIFFLVGGVLKLFTPKTKTINELLKSISQKRNKPQSTNTINSNQANTNPNNTINTQTNNFRNDSNNNII
ncbi:hypothetical protein ASO20_02855 [Mycoplasma sp. (ex Biomphalaria glabrata)]|uniref:hypothetical protein n=1 Tax=Mycoplasma sp. (ex Biomphalaria glabrata) TaxID=1749074 RepID=UPI00073AA5C3|nr:hypothetical protein [Mycoplasma sp. (ex Biomphalaria glabrata)]ALV23573.1 hypothetical protein ASO20_02855 [Mycoplasma sp. (ex Biomphalaria glabrata)]